MARETATARDGKRRGFSRFAAALLAIGALTGAGGESQAEIACESALDHISECCPGFDTARVDCGANVGCESGGEPSLDPDESRCITASTCDELRAKGVCARVGDVTNSPEAAAVDGGAPTTDPLLEICP